MQGFYQQIENENKKRLEFYEKINEDVKAEFINGKIIFHSPAKSEHLQAVGNLFNLLKNYVVKKNLGKVFSEHALISLTRNDYEPDIVFWKTEKAQKFTEGQMRFPAPDFIVEVLSESTEKYDRGIKFEDYALHGVEEYWLVDTKNKIVEQYKLLDGKYQLHKKTDSGEIESLVIKGFKIPIKSIFDEVENLKVLKGLME